MLNSAISLVAGFDFELIIIIYAHDLAARGLFGCNLTNRER